MANGWSPKLVIDSGTKLSISANMSAAPVAETSITAGGALKGFVVGIYVEGLAGVVSAQLQHSFGKGLWENVSGKTVTLANGWNYIKVNGLVSADQALMPLFDSARVTVTSNGAGAGTISALGFLQEL